MSKSTLILVSIIALASAQLDMLSDKMDFEDNIAEESQSDEQIFVNAITSKPILNDGKPFYVARDPTTGTFDFNFKKTVGIQNDIPVSQKDEQSAGSKGGNDINSLGHNNFHDYLNLPVKYSSSKFVYPLISGSYANLKYQGNNKNQISNHKNYTTTLGTTTQSPKYFTHITAPVKNEFTATFKHPETTRQSTQKPTTTVTEKSTTASKAPTTQSSTVKYSSTIVQNSFPSTFKNKYVDSSETRKKTTTAETTLTSTTKVIETSTKPASPVKFLDDLLESVETKPTTYRPPFDATRLSFSTSMPLKPHAFRPMSTESPKDQSKISFEKAPMNPSIMTLSEIINSFTENDDVSNEQNTIHYDTADSSPVEVKKPPPPTTFAPKTSSTINQHKTLQQQMQNQPNYPNQPKPQFVDLPVHQPDHFGPPSTHIGFPEQFEDYVEFENPKDQASQYVKYEVQKPNTNLVKFQQAPSMNNVVISPGQNSASFVLGSQQSVGSVGIGSTMGVGTSHFVDGGSSGPMKVGQVIDEPAVRLPLQPATNQIQASIRFPNDGESSFGNAQIVKGTIKLDGTADSVQPPQALSQQTQKPLVFPSVELPAPTPTNPSQIIFENVNDIYGKINDKKMKEEFASNELSNSIPAGELTPPQMFTPPSPTQQRPFNRLPQHYNHRRPGPPGPPGPVRHNLLNLPNILPQFRPNAKASQGHPHMYKDVGAIRVPMQGPNQFNRQYQSAVPLPKAGLPPMMPQQLQQHKQQQHHMLPQHQHLQQLNPQQQQQMMNQQHQHQQHQGMNQQQQHQQPQMMNQQQQHQQPQTMTKPPQMMTQQPQQQQNQQQQHTNPQQHQQNLNPNFRRMPSHPNQMNRMQGQNPHHQHPQFDQSHETGNRRLFRVPPHQPQMNDRGFMSLPPPPGFQLRRPTNGAPETLQMQQRPSNIPQSPDFELNKSSPPPALQQFAPLPFVHDDDSNNTRLEPVITLQMLHNKKTGTATNKLNLPPVPHDIPQDIQATLPSNHKEEKLKKPSIYVVYPVTSNSYENSASAEHNNAESSVVVAHHGESPLAGASEYQNTPFSVVSHFEQEPLLMKKDKKKNQFPYHLERPAPSNDYKFERPNYGQHEGFGYNTGEEPTNAARVVNKRPSEIPDAAISSKLTRVTEKPIAIAYTPTEPNRSFPPSVTNFYHNSHPHHHYSNHYELEDKFSMPNYGGPVISEILDEKHVGFDYYHRQQALQQQHLNNGEDLGFYKEHYDFQAPFQASVSLNPEVTNPYEGWAILPQTTDTNKIDRADVHVVESSEEVSTKKFDVNDFQPVFESGFQPIYSERKVSTAPELLADSSELPFTLALTHSTTPQLITTPTTPRTTTLPATSSSEASLEMKSSEETTTKKVEKKKQKVEIDSLEAFFESLTRDYDDDESNKSENESSTSL